MKVTLNRGTQVKTVPLGFSWTTLFFRWLVPLLRGDWLGFLIMLLVFNQSFRDQAIGFQIWWNQNTASGIGFSIWGLISIFFACMYNRFYIRRLLEKGFVAAHLDYQLLVEREVIDENGEVLPLFRKLRKSDFIGPLIILGIYLIIVFGIPFFIHLFQGTLDPAIEFNHPF